MFCNLQIYSFQEKLGQNDHWHILPYVFVHICSVFLYFLFLTSFLLRHVIFSRTVSLHLTARDLVKSPFFYNTCLLARIKKTINKTSSNENLSYCHNSSPNKLLSHQMIVDILKEKKHLPIKNKCVTKLTCHALNLFTTF